MATSPIQPLCVSPLRYVIPIVSVQFPLNLLLGFVFVPSATLPADGRDLGSVFVASGFRREPFALGNQLLQPHDQFLGKGGAEVVVAVNSGAGQEKVAQLLATGLVQVIGKECQETFQEFTLTGLGPTQPRGGESVAAAGVASVLHSVKDGFELSGQGLIADTALHPAIKAVSYQLPLEDGCGIEIAARRAHLSLQHGAGIREEIQVVGSAVHDGVDYGITVLLL